MPTLDFSNSSLSPPGGSVKGSDPHTSLHYDDYPQGAGADPYKQLDTLVGITATRLDGRLSSLTFRERFVDSLRWVMDSLGIGRRRPVRATRFGYVTSLELKIFTAFKLNDDLCRFPPGTDSSGNSFQQTQVYGGTKNDGTVVDGKLQLRWIDSQGLLQSTPITNAVVTLTFIPPHFPPPTPLPTFRITGKMEGDMEQPPLGMAPHVRFDSDSPSSPVNPKDLQTIFRVEGTKMTYHFV